MNKTLWEGFFVPPFFICLLTSLEIWYIITVYKNVIPYHCSVLTLKEFDIMVDLSTPSSYKYIYEVYMNNKNELVCEKFSVVYVNETYCYFIKPGNIALNCINTVTIRNNIDDLIKKGKIEKIAYSLLEAYNSYYFWSPLDVNESALFTNKIIKFNKKRKLEIINWQIENKKHDIIKWKNNIQEDEKKIDKLKKVQKELLKELENL